MRLTQESTVTSRGFWTWVCDHSERREVCGRVGWRVTWFPLGDWMHTLAARKVGRGDHVGCTVTEAAPHPPQD